MFKIFRNLLPRCTNLKLSHKSFNHCSALSPLNNGILIGWYTGFKECVDQHICLSYFKNNKILEQTFLESDTGNLVFVPIRKNLTKIIYSRFTDSLEISKLIDKWKYCELYMRDISYNKGLKISEETKIFNSNQHLLPRCSPIKFHNDFLIPLYDEVAQHGVIFSLNEMKLMGKIGNFMIQPTIWEKDGKLMSLSRNFHSDRLVSQYCESIDGGRTWSDPINTLIPNCGSSLNVVKYNNEYVAIWNDTYGRIRKHMSIGIIDFDRRKLKINPIQRFGYGAYPYSIVDQSGNLVFSFTSNRSIEFNIWNKKEYEKRRGNMFKNNQGQENQTE